MDLRAAREAKGWSQETLAAKLGMSRRQVIRCEQGNKLPRNTLVAAKWRKLLS